MSEAKSKPRIALGMLGLDLIKDGFDDCGDVAVHSPDLGFRPAVIEVFNPGCGLYLFTLSREGQPARKSPGPSVASPKNPPPGDAALPRENRDMNSANCCFGTGGANRSKRMRHEGAGKRPGTSLPVQ